MFLLGSSLRCGFRWVRTPRAALLTAGVGLATGVLVVADSVLFPGSDLADDTASAGAAWLAVRNSWVDTYELSEVDVEVGGAELLTLVLTDTSGRTVRIGFVALQSNSALWDLVHNGIMHSERDRAVVSARAREELRLDDGTGDSAR